MSSKKKRVRQAARERPKNTRSLAFLVSDEAYETLCISGYTRLDQNPEIVTACRKIADTISSMTIYLMSNTESGDKRVKNELSRKVDISPNQYMTRKTWMDAIVMNLLLYGKGNSVVIPLTENGILQNMIIADPDTVSFIPKGYGYEVVINGITYNHDDLLHFVHNPDEHYPWKGKGLTTTLKDVAHNLKQAAATERGFMESKWKPSIIVKVDGLIDEFSSPEGREKLLNEYIISNSAGEPWLIPADQFSVEQIKPLSLADLAINDTVEIDKKTIAAIMGVPAFLLGVGNYDSKEWDAFINNTIKPIAKEIEQELTRKLIISEKWYWSFNISSLYSYDLKTVADVYSNLYVRGIVNGNEVRDKLSMSPMDGLNELVILENYIPLNKIGQQLKLKQEENNE